MKKQTTKKQTKKVVAKKKVATKKPRLAKKEVAQIRQELARHVQKDRANRATRRVEAANAVPVPPAPVVPPMPAPAQTSQAWRAGIDWVAAGKKAHETRMRNLAAKASASADPLQTFVARGQAAQQAVNAAIATATPPAPKRTQKTPRAAATPEGDISRR